MDVIRFNGDGTVIFYSDNVPNSDSVGDTPSAQHQRYTNQASAAEAGPEGNNSAIYTPGSGQPGYDAVAHPTYRFVSDGSLVGTNFLVNYFAGADGSRPDQTVRITNPGASTDPGANPSGDLCANIYVFRNDQQLTECCSCLVTPDGLRTLSVDFDLTHNPLTAGAVGEGVIKIVSSAGTSCSSATAASNYAPAGELKAWGTHNQDVSGGLSGTGVINAVTETHFLGATLSNAELSSIQSACAFIVSQGSGAGICSCGRGD